MATGDDESRCWCNYNYSLVTVILHLCHMVFTSPLLEFGPNIGSNSLTELQVNY